MLTTSITSTMQNTFDVYLLSIERYTEDVFALCLDCSSSPMSYREGQFLALELPDGHLRSYSLATPCADHHRLQLQVRAHAGGAMARWLASNPASGTTLRVHGPYGDCTWQPVGHDAAIVMLATGTGIAPLYAMLLRALASTDSSTITLYWGVRIEADLYLMQALQQLSAATPRFTVVPALSRPAAHWTGATGHVQHVAMQHHPDLRRAQVYACGAPAMVADARIQLVAHCGLQPSHFWADAFAPATSAASAMSAAMSAATVTVTAHTHEGRQQLLALAAGASLYSGLKAANLIQGVCGGNLSCGTCRIRPDPAWAARLPAMGRGEKRLLAALDEVADGDRLACQISITSDLSGMPVRLYQPAW